MLGRAREHRPDGVIGDLVADHMKQRQHGVEGSPELDSADIALLAGESFARDRLSDHLRAALDSDYMVAALGEQTTMLAGARAKFQQIFAADAMALQQEVEIIHLRRVVLIAVEQVVITAVGVEGHRDHS